MTGGVVFRPTLYCRSECGAEYWPCIPIDPLKPARSEAAVQRVGWVRTRADAGLGLVEG